MSNLKSKDKSIYTLFKKYTQNYTLYFFSPPSIDGKCTGKILEGYLPN